MAWTHKLWGAKQRPWGFEVRVDVTNTDTGQVYNEVLMFPNKAAALDAKTSGDALAMLKNQVKARVMAEAKAAQDLNTCPACHKVI